MKTYTVSGFRMTKDTDTWKLNRVGFYTSVTVESSTNNVEALENAAAIKIKSDSFEAINIQAH